LPDPKQRYAARSGPLRILVIGGSLGAAALNEAIPIALSRIDPAKRPHVVHQSGEKHLQSLTKSYAQVNVDATCAAFIDDMAQAMSDADLIICRAGAMTVSEVAAVGVAALFVPFPFAVDDHQTANAEHLVKHEAAYLKQQRDLAIEWLALWLEAQTRDTLSAVAVKAREQAKPQATDVIGAKCLSLLEGVQ